jgi:RNA polymerase sigma-32 factor
MIRLSEARVHSQSIQEVAMAQAAGVSRQFVKAAMSAPFLERAQERTLAERWRHADDETALHALAHAHMRLVMAVAMRFRHYGLPVADLVQEGHVGLLEAAARFEPEREVRFSTYATWWIRASIQDYVLRNWSIVRGGTSSAQKALFFNLRRLRARLAQRGDQPSSHSAHSQIALALGVSLSDVEGMNARLSGPDVSLNAPVGDDESASAERGDFLVDTTPLADEVVGARIDGERRSKWLKEALSTLSEREMRILQARQLEEDSKTLEMLGVELGISKERVRQIESRALDKLKRNLLTRHADATDAAAIARA